MPDRHTDPEIRAVADQIFKDLLSDLLLTTVISAHREIKRGRAVCGTCGTKCRTHLPLIQSGTAPSSSHISTTLLAPSQEAGPSRTTSPQPRGPSSQSSTTENKKQGYTVGPEKGTGGATGVGSGSGRMDTNGNVFFDCLVCGRAVVSSKYAPHLSGCLGLNGSTRRGTSRLAATKARLNGNDRSSPSPYVNGSENGESDVDSSTGKKKRPGSNGNGRRAKSPTKATPPKKSKPNPSSQSAASSLLPPRVTLPPSRLGGKPMRISSPDSSPSPQKSNASSFDFASVQGGTTGAKTVPGASQSAFSGDAEGSLLGEDMQGRVVDDSDEGDDDDY